MSRHDRTGAARRSDFPVPEIVAQRGVKCAYGTSAGGREEALGWV
jgi:hypothetical protein